MIEIRVILFTGLWVNPTTFIAAYRLLSAPFESIRWRNSWIITWIRNIRRFRFGFIVTVQCKCWFVKRFYGECCRRTF